MKLLHSVYTKILLIILLVFAFPLIVLFFYGYHSLEGIIQQKIVQQSQTSMDGLEKSLQDMVNRVSQTASHLSTDVSLNELLAVYDRYIPSDHVFAYSGQVPDYLNRYEYLQMASGIALHLSNYADNWLPDGTQVSLVLNDGQLFCTWPSYNTDYEMLDEILSSNNTDAFFSQVHRPLVGYSDRSYQISFIKSIYSMRDTRKQLAKVMITVPLSAFNKVLSNYKTNPSYLLITDVHGDIVTHVTEDASALADSVVTIRQYEEVYKQRDESATINQVFIDSGSIDGIGWKVYLLVF